MEHRAVGIDERYDSTMKISLHRTKRSWRFIVMLLQIVGKVNDAAVGVEKKSLVES